MTAPPPPRSAEAGAPLLLVENLVVALPLGAAEARVVDGVSFSIRPGEAVGLVGESGAGKSMTALTLAGLHPDGARLGGRVTLAGEALPLDDDRAMSRLRGSRLGVVFQEPMSALNPLKRIGDQIAEGLRIHGLANRAEASARADALLERVGLTASGVTAQRYPHELSGGQRQRVALAIALACGPDLLIADEPTTALDVLAQARVLDLIDSFARGGARTGAPGRMGLLLVSHDLGVIAERTDRVLVMYGGRVVEGGPTAAVLADPAHPYTRGLIAAMPPRDPAGPRPRRLATIPGQVPGLGAARPPCPFEPRCPLAAPVCRAPPRVDLGHGREALCARLDVSRAAFRASGGAGPAQGPAGAADGRPLPPGEPLLRLDALSRAYPLPRPLGSALLDRLRGGREAPVFRALDGVSLTVGRGDSVGLVGASGSGKSTLARLILGLDRASGGAVLFEGEDAAPSTPAGLAALARLRARTAIVFQDPFGSLDPRWTIEAIVAEPLLALRPDEPARARRARAAAALADVGLGADALQRRPYAFSGGQRQRIAIARALVTEPDLVIADEAVSALDLSIQAGILNLFADLRERRGFACLFISHDLSVVAQATDRLCVMAAGRIVEEGPTRAVLAAPKHEATRALVAAIPRLPGSAGGAVNRA